MSAAVGFGTRAVTFTTCVFNNAAVNGQKFFAGRWQQGARFYGCEFGTNPDHSTDVYFDTDHWTSYPTFPPLFFFDNCGFQGDVPVTVEDTVHVGFHGRQASNGAVFDGFETPGDIRLPRASATVNRIRFGASTYLFKDTAGLLRLSPNALPAADSDGRIITLQRSGTVSPVNASTPAHAGSIYVDTTGQRSYVSYGTGNAQWDIIPRVFSGSRAQDWPLIPTGKSSQTTVNVPGAAVGDTNIGVAMSAVLPAGMYFAMPEVTAPNTVTVTLVNGAAADLDPLSSTLTVRIMRL